MMKITENMVKATALKDLMDCIETLVGGRARTYDIEKHEYVLKKELSEEDTCYIYELTELSNKLFSR